MVTCYFTPPSYSPNNCRLIIGVRWHSPWPNFTRSAHEYNSWHVFGDYNVMIITQSIRGQWDQTTFDEYHGYHNSTQCLLDVMLHWRRYIEHDSVIYAVLLFKYLLLRTIKIWQINEESSCDVNYLENSFSYIFIDMPSVISDSVSRWLKESSNGQGSTQRLWYLARGIQKA